MIKQAIEAALHTSRAPARARTNRPSDSHICLVGKVTLVAYASPDNLGVADRLPRPVLFGEQGAARVTYEVDAVHDDLGIVGEIEAGRGAMGNAIYRDIIRSSLIVDARYFVLGVMQEYRYGAKQTVKRSYAEARAISEAIYGNGRLRLPFQGVLVFGY